LPKGDVMRTLIQNKPFWYRKKAHFYLWTIRHQNKIAAAIRTQMMSAVFVVLLLTILLPIRLETALQVIFCGGMLVIGLLWALIERRRSWLLRITDPVLKETAHQTMITYLRRKTALAHPQKHLGKKNCTRTLC
jgi:hypothetical protein